MTGHELAERRRALGISQAQLARTLEISVRVIQSWESGARQPGSITARWLDAQFARLEREREPRGQDST